MVTILTILWLATATQPAVPVLSLEEEIVLARLKEVRAIGPAYDTFSFEGFDPSAYPTVIRLQDGSLIAAGFREPAPDFARLKGVTDGARPIDRGPAKALPAGISSPARIGDRWAVVTRMEPPEPLARGDRIGRRSAEEWIADVIGDAFLIFMMERRGAAVPRPLGLGAQPERAEIMALANVEQQLLLRGARLLPNERTFDDYNRGLRQLIAVRRERLRLMGADLAVQEQTVEAWDGMRIYAVGLAYRHAASGAFEPSGLHEVDATFGRYWTSIPLRLTLTNLPMILAPDTPEVTHAQIVMRTAALTFILDKVGGPEWRAKALRGDRQLIDLLAEGLPTTAEEEADHLASARAEYAYEPALRQARADLERLALERERALAKLFPVGAERVEIWVRRGRMARYEDDPMGAAWAGQGRLVHRTPLALEGRGVRLEFTPAEGGPAAVMTRCRGRRDEIDRIVVPLPPGTLAPLAEARLLNPDRPFRVEAPGLVLEAVDGVLQPGASGAVVVEIL